MYQMMFSKSVVHHSRDTRYLEENKTDSSNFHKRIIGYTGPQNDIEITRTGLRSENEAEVIRERNKRPFRDQKVES